MLKFNIRKLIASVILFSAIFMGMAVAHNVRPITTYGAELNDTDSASLLYSSRTSMSNVAFDLNNYNSTGYVSLIMGSSTTYTFDFTNMDQIFDQWDSIVITNAKVVFEYLAINTTVPLDQHNINGANAVNGAYTSSNKTLTLDLTSGFPSTAEIELWWNVQGESGGGPSIKPGSIRLYSIMIYIDYYFSIPDDMQSVFDTDDAAIVRPNLLKPNISFPIDVKGIQLDYDYETGIYTLDGTANETKTIAIIFTDFFDPGDYVLQYFYISGNMDNYFYIVNTPGWNMPIVKNKDSKQNNTVNKKTITSTFQLYFNFTNEVLSYDNFKFKLQLEKGTVATEWHHPDYYYAQTAKLINFDQPLTAQDILDNVRAYDDVDGDVSDRINFMTNPEAFAIKIANQLGVNYHEEWEDAFLLDHSTASSTLQYVVHAGLTITYQYIFDKYTDYVNSTYLGLAEIIPDMNYKEILYVSDTSGNYSYLEIWIIPKDVTAPVGPSTQYVVTASYKQTLNPTHYINSIIFTDNVGVTLITIVSDNYTPNKSVPGQYIVQYKAVDASGNAGYHDAKFIVVDDIMPTINGPETIFKPQTSTLTAAQIKIQLTAFDEISGILTSSIYIISDTYTGFGHIKGTYRITFGVKDLAGNEANYTVTLIVSDNMPPVIYIRDNFFVSVSSTVNLTLGDVINIFVITGQLEITSTTNYTTLINEYVGNEKTPGIYTISIRFSQTSGITIVKSLSVNVVNTDTPQGVITPSNNSHVFILMLIPIILVGAYLLLKDNKKGGRKYA